MGLVLIRVFRVIRVQILVGQSMVALRAAERFNGGRNDAKRVDTKGGGRDAQMRETLQMALTPAEKRIVTAVGFDEDVCDFIQTECSGTLRRLTTFNDEFELQDADDLVVTVSPEKVVPIIGRLQPKLLSRGYRVFWSDEYDARGSSRQDVIVVVKNVDDFEIIRVKRTSGCNYDVTTAALLQRLQTWREHCEFQVVGAGAAWVAIQFVTLPQNVCGFAEEIFDFCPDTVIQGVGLQNEKDCPKKFDAARRLCPRLSAKTERKLAEERARFEAIEMPPEVRAQFQLSGFTTPTDMGIRLLAYELNTTKQLYMWWD